MDLFAIGLGLVSGLIICIVAIYSAAPRRRKEDEDDGSSLEDEALHPSPGPSPDAAGGPGPIIRR